ncbi:MAG: hypothetical protein JWO03_644 [Bacteroidetes bacterium]|nr:hypothetical protein [Bacteroidota bacterium]
MFNKLLLTLIFFVVTVLQFDLSASALYYTASITKGDPKILKGQKLKVVFVYGGMMVGEMKEADYVAGKVRDYNGKKTGSGDKWLAEWKGNRSSLFEPEFIKEFNYQGEKIKTSVQTAADDAIYTLVITTTYSEPGFNAGPIARAARINATCEFKDVKGNTVVTMVLDNIASPTMMNDDFETSTRFTECYVRLAKEVAKAIKKAK